MKGILFTVLPHEEEDAKAGLAKHSTFHDDQNEELLDIYHQGEYLKAQWDELAPMASDPDAAGRHLQAIASQVQVSEIRAAAVKVAVDCVNGACSSLQLFQGSDPPFGFLCGSDLARLLALLP